jgi:soluble lytic murein transglycosylase-like protein
MPCPEWCYALPWRLIQASAKEFSISPILIASVIQVESAGNTHACRYEPRWKHYPSSNEISTLSRTWGASFDTVKVLMSTSWGLCQVIGTVALENGYQDWSNKLCIPEIGIHYGAKILKKKQERYGSDPCKIYASFNAGSVRMTDGGMFINQKNVDHFYKYYRELERLI